MTRRDSQLDILEKRFPGIRDDLGVYDSPQGEVKIVPAKSGDLTVSMNGRWLYSTIDPYRDVLRSMPKLDPHTDLVIAAGLGLGYHVERFLQDFPDLPVLVAEPDPGFFLKVLKERDVSFILKHPLVSFLFGGSPRGIISYLEQFSCSKAVFFPLRTVFEQHFEWFKELEKNLNDFQSTLKINDQTLRRFYPLWLKNHTKNWALVKTLQPVKLLRQAAQGAHAVIAAAGPSLVHSLEWIQKHRKEVILIAVDTSFNVLRKKNLTPDFLVFMDGQYWNSRHVDAFVPSTTKVVAELSSHPRALRCAPNRTYIASSSIPFLQTWEKACLPALGKFKSGGCVAAAAWELALLLGCRRVYFAGLDLGYPQCQTHARGSQFEEAIHFISNRFTPAETRGFRLLNEITLTKKSAWDGSTILSDTRMDLYRSWFEVSFLDHPEVEPVNLSPFGSLIKGMKQQEDQLHFPSFTPINVSTAFLKPKTNIPGMQVSFLKEVCDFLVCGLKQETFRSHNWFSQFNDYSQQAKNRWGEAAWAMLVARQENSMRYFPTARSLQAVIRAWQLALDIAIFWQEIKNNKTISRKTNLKPIQK